MLSRVLCLISGWLVLSVPIASAQINTLKVGVLPNVSARVLLSNYLPMRQYLERVVGQPVEVLTAPSFVEFHERSGRGDYDLIVTAPNLGRLAQLDAGAQLLGVYEPPNVALAVVSKANRLESVEALRGRSLALSNPQSLVALSGFAWLEQRAMRRNRDYTTFHARNDDSLGQVLRSGEAPLAVMSAGEFRQIAPSIRAELDVFAEVAQLPGFFVLARSGLPEQLMRPLQRALGDFFASPEGKQFTALSGVTAIRPVREGELDTVNAFLEDTRAGLRAAR